MAFRTDEQDAPETIIFARSVAAQMARVSLEFLELVESEELLQPRLTAAGEAGYAAADIQKLIQIRRLHEILGLDLPAVEVVLHLREQIMELLSRMEEVEERFARRERELLREIEELRRRLLVGR